MAAVVLVHRKCRHTCRCEECIAVPKLSVRTIQCPCTSLCVYFTPVRLQGTLESWPVGRWVLTLKVTRADNQNKCFFGSDIVASCSSTWGFCSLKAGSQVRRNDASTSARKCTCEPGRRKHKRKRKKKERFPFSCACAYVIPVHTYVFLRLCLRLCLRRCVVRVNQPLGWGNFLRWGTFWGKAPFEGEATFEGRHLLRGRQLLREGTFWGGGTFWGKAPFEGEAPFEGRHLLISIGFKRVRMWLMMNCSQDKSLIAL